MIAVRAAGAADAAALEALHTRTWREAYWGALPDRVAATGLYDADAWRATLARATRPEGRDLAVLVAEDDAGAPDAGRLLGFAMAGPAQIRENSARRPPWDGEVFMLYVLASAQRRGVGGLLLSRCARHLAGRGLFTLGLWCVVDNRPARAFYEAMGGRFAGTRMQSLRGAATPVAGYAWDEAAVSDLIAAA